ncbi:winged helix-turn-helix domain-containing protein [Methanobrevibacter sp. TMH8]|uniref:winged helix-turn-helix domain-containing protein n=1 Tax=Methanobrevibacter sp. TMH8 TaxID=2848611 RepID=UPI001CCA67C8|nr:winged helix-turn-helix domain-containing protein [Methanobrevibacter sp. TMH8]MBZ9570150.1 winged helix-turn-helix domain-containing protein [Methanobrevibacter sp. TMH8]
MKRLLWYIIAGTRGGVNRAKIINFLNERPYNANQLSKLLNLDYKTITHHLKVLEDNKIIISGEEKYGNLYFLTEKMENNYKDFLEIWKNIER